jgi:hypothetical protein
MVSSVRPAFRSEIAGSVWDSYRHRAQELNDRAANPLLTKYLDIVSIQYELSLMLIQTCEGPNVNSDLPLLSYFNDEALRPLLAKASGGVAASGLAIAGTESPASLEYLLHQNDKFEYPVDFPARLVLEVFATEVSVWPHREIETSPDHCPHCGFPVLCSVLREEGMGRRRSGCCSLCASEWSVSRLGCLRCGEQQPGKLPHFTFEDFSHIHIEACDSCGGWLKSMDLTRDAESLPVSDDIWSSAVDLWAAEQGYERIGNHLFRL